MYKYLFKSIDIRLNTTCVHNFCTFAKISQISLKYLYHNCNDIHHV